MLNDVDIFESASMTLSDEGVGRRYKVRLIEGDRMGSSGYYPAETLLRDGPRIFKAGTPMYLDHQTPEEREAKPHGSVLTLAGELAEDAYYDNDGLYADIEVFEHQRPLIKSLKDKIGISIRARAKSITEDINGKPTKVFKELIMARSADFVVKAGAGGKIVSILESALDSDADSEIKEGNENMDEVLEELKALRTDFDTRLKAIEEAAKPAEKLEESAPVEADYEKALEIAEALSASKLDKTGKARVLDLHRANKKPIAELIEAEEAYIAANVTKNSESEGSEENAEESAKETTSTPVTVKVPSVWKRDK